MSKDKSRFFTFILYPESSPDDFITKLELTDIAMAISPLHDKDKSADGTYKKAHYHVIYIAKNPVTTDAVRKKIKRLLGNNSLSKVEVISTSVKNTYLYLTHESKDAIDKHKHVYDKADITTLNGFDVDRYDTLDLADKKVLRGQIRDIIVDYKCQNINELEKIVRAMSDELGLPGRSTIDDSLYEYGNFYRLYFDGNYQFYNNSRKPRR